MEKEGRFFVIESSYYYCQTIYDHCKNNVLNPSFSVLLLKIDSVYDIESRIASLNNKLSIHSLKWGKYIERQ